MNMARHALKRDVKGRCEFGYEQRLTVQPLQDPAADGIAESTEHPVEPRIAGAPLDASRTDDPGNDLQRCTYIHHT